MLLDGQADIEFVGSTATVDEVIAMDARAAPAVVIFNGRAVDSAGADGAISIQRAHPNTRFVFITGGETAQHVLDDVRLIAAL
jgi:DNA-binding NarL/FixJ family response regulator